MHFAGVLLGAASLFASACDAPPPFKHSRVLGGKSVCADTLGAGRSAYRNYCLHCHGAEGDGNGPAGRALDPRPRDFTKGTFKFASVRAGELPTDADLIRVTKRGLAGTGMLPWDIPDGEIQAAIQYLKTFSPRWRRELPGDPVTAGPDPWNRRDAAALERGRAVYHAIARCWACHPAYISRNGILASTGGIEPREHVDEPAVPVGGDEKFRTRAPDFLRDNIRSGTDTLDLYRSIACGLGGTAMPTYKGALREDDLWALVRYVQWLTRQRGGPGVEAVRRRMRGP